MFTILTLGGDYIIINIFMNYQEFLKSKHIPQKKITFFLFWVNQYNQLCKKNKLKSSSADKINTFILSLEKKYEPWQVTQAKEAVRLFLYWQKTNTDQKNNSSSVSNNHLAWKEIESEMIRILRLKQRSYRTEQSYLTWLKQFSSYLKFKDLNKISQDDFRQFLSYIAVERKVAKSTQNQAFNAILFAFKYVFEKEVKNLNDAVFSNIPRKLPMVLTKQEILSIFSHLKDQNLLILR